MKRKIVKIDENKCNGCGICIPSCAEGALKIIDGKARLIAESFCDGLGACLGECPEDAIIIEEREADEFDEEAVEEHLKKEAVAAEPPKPVQHTGCPGSAMRMFEKEADSSDEPFAPAQSQLGQWPVQLMLVPPAAPFLKGSDLVICADCVPFAYADFHRTYLKGKAVLVGCPKLDDLNFYREKLKDIFREAQPSRITVLKMEVPCCGGIAFAAMEARNEAAPDCNIEIHTIGIQGSVSCEKG
ncbi:ATP-binding protein [Candidatus Omnitrophota bacterium]